MYTKLLDVDKVDLIVSGYGTNVIAPAMPVIIQHNRTFLSLFGLAVNGNFHYPKYFTITPTGPDPAVSSTIGFFEVGEMQNPKPKTLAIVAADAEYPRTSAEGVKKNGCCPAQPSGAGERRLGSVKLTMPRSTQVSWRLCE